MPSASVVVPPARVMRPPPVTWLVEPLAELKTTLSRTPMKPPSALASAQSVMGPLLLCTVRDGPTPTMMVSYDLSKMPEPLPVVVSPALI